MSLISSLIENLTTGTLILSNELAAIHYLENNGQLFINYPKGSVAYYYPFNDGVSTSSEHINDIIHESEDFMPYIDIINDNKVNEYENLFPSHPNLKIVILKENVELDMRPIIMKDFMIVYAAQYKDVKDYYALANIHLTNEDKFVREYHKTVIHDRKINNIKTEYGRWFRDFTDTLINVSLMNKKLQMF